MKKQHIAEDLPARKFPQASLNAKKEKPNAEKKEGSDRSSGGAEPSIEEKVSQAASDIRYRSRRENIPLRQAFEDFFRNSSADQRVKDAVRQKLFGSSSIVKEDYLKDTHKLATQSVAKAMYNVFVQNEYDGEIDEEYLEELKKGYIKREIGRVDRGAGDKKYKVRVTDPQNKVTYVRYANREKINQLRAKGLDVEMTEHGEPYEGEKEKGEQTASALGGGKKNDGNLANNYPPYDKVTKGDVVAGRRGEDQQGGKNVKEELVGNQHRIDANKNNKIDSDDFKILRGKKKSEKSVEEEYLGELNDDRTIDVKGKRKPNKIVVHHQNQKDDDMRESSYSQFLELINEKKLTTAEKAKKEKIVKALKPKYGKSSKTYAIATSVAKKVAEEKCDPEDQNTDKFNIKDKNPDPRSIPTAINLAKTAARFRGARNPIVMAASYEPEGEVIDERRREDRGKRRPPINHAMVITRSKHEEGLITRSGQTIATHKKARGVTKLERQSQETKIDPETNQRTRIRPESEGPTPAKKIETKKQKIEAAKAAAQREREEEDRKRRL